MKILTTITLPDLTRALARFQVQAARKEKAPSIIVGRKPRRQIFKATSVRNRP